MKNSKLLEFYRSVSPKELREFGFFLACPLFNKHDRIVQLHRLLQPFHPSFEDPHCSKASLSALLFGEEAKRAQRFDDLMSYLLKLAEQYLAVRNLNSHPQASGRFMLNELVDRNMEKSIRHHIRRGKQEWSVHRFEDQDHYLHRYLLADAADRYISKKEMRAFDTSIQEKADSLDLFYLLEKLKTWCEMFNRQNIVQADYRFTLLNEVLTYLDDHREIADQHPPIAIYRTILDTLQNPDEQTHYQELTVLLAEHAGLFSKEEAQNLYAYAENYCIKKINSGRSEYLPRLFELYQTLLEKQLNITDGQISQWDYKNIITVGCRLKAYTWTGQFIQRYKSHLPDHCRENAFHFNLASFHYEQGQLEEAMSILQTVEFTDVYYNLSGRSMLLKIYYELDEIDPLLSHIEAFKQFLRRNKKISKYQYKAHMNLIRFASRLLKLKLRRSSARSRTIAKNLQELRNKVDVQQEISNAQWLSEKMAELEEGSIPVS